MTQEEILELEKYATQFGIRHMHSQKLAEMSLSEGRKIIDNFFEIVSSETYHRQLALSDQGKDEDED